MGKFVAVEKEIIEETLASTPTQGKKLLEPLKSFAAAHELPFKILEDSEVVNAAEVHEHEGDLWYCLEGEVAFVCGGKLVQPKQDENDPREWRGDGIEGGEEFVMHLGDWLWIPAGEPHLHKTTGTARLIIIKIPVMNKK